MKGPVYVYYQLDNFYQNHRRYVKITEQIFYLFYQVNALGGIIGIKTLNILHS